MAARILIATASATHHAALTSAADQCRRPVPPTSAADQERGLALYGEGVVLRAIARAFGVTPPAVRRSQKAASANWNEGS